MVKFKYENCTSKQYVRATGWIPEGRIRKVRVAALAKKPSAQRRLRYLTFCAEGALDVRALEKAKIIRRRNGLYDTVYFFDLSQQGVDKTLDIIEGAIGFPIDFFKLMTLNHPALPDDESADFIRKDVEESAELFRQQKEWILYDDLRKSFPFDLINLDVERYVMIPDEQVPGRLLEAWDKILLWQLQKGRHQNREYELDQFTLFFTTKVGPHNLPDEHRSALVDVIGHNLQEFPSLAETLTNRFQVSTAEALYDQNFDEFLKLAVPKALISRALSHDWTLDIELSYRAFEFVRHPDEGVQYTMLHFILHFCRCKPSVNRRVHPQVLPAAVRTVYEESVKKIFETSCDDVDVSKVATEEALRTQLQGLGVEV